jgi:ferredoxin, 2Fe-2S
MTDVAQTTTIQMHVQDLAGESRTIEGEIGSSLMEIIRSAGIDDIPAYCGGCCSCASCHVQIDADFVSLLPTMSQDEEDLLDGSEHRVAGSRLSCQIPATAALSGIRLTIAPQQD